ncbi:MAG: ATP-dependent DNA helicase RecG [Planctomycetota bacterium]
MKKLTDSVQYLNGVGPQRFKLFQRIGIRNIYDLLFYLPRKYLDRSRIKKIRDVVNSAISDEEVTVKGEITAISYYRTKYHKNIFEIVLSDETGHLSATWFNQPYLRNVFAKSQTVILSGKMRFYKHLQLSSPEYEIIPAYASARGGSAFGGKSTAGGLETKPGNFSPLHTQGIVPCYSLTESLGQKFLRRTIKNCLSLYLPLVDELTPRTLTGSLSENQERVDNTPASFSNAMSLSRALGQIHFPDSQEIMEKARQYLIYDELFLFQLALGLRRYQIKQTSVKHRIKISGQLDERIRKRIPFQLTRAQEKVIREIRTDLPADYPMNRLLQGDVGSGKTIVAVYAILAAIGNGLQVALMAPTEILAEQHFRTISKLLADSRVRMLFLTSGLKTKERRMTREILNRGEVDLVIGTHALIQKDVVFKKLGLLIIDEQHKFGVMQRADLRNKGENPHVLIMTATPIPRTLALTAFGDLDISTIDELPPGRMPVRTVLRLSSRMPDAFDFIRHKIQEGCQVYFVYPLIEDSPETTQTQQQLYRTNLKSATTMAKYLKEKIFPECNVAVLHGDMNDKKKEKIMRDFRDGKINILVSTVVIEVGIDVPNASVMVIEHAERYGLAQLHQLRGRIGRGSHQSYCLLFGDFTTSEAEQRLKIMEETNDGFIIAEEDLRIRGPGEFLGIKQSGLPEFKIANLATDFNILKLARTDAQKAINNNRQYNKKLLHRISLHFRNLIMSS